MPGERAEWHGILLRLAGWLRDDVLAEARAFLADGRPDRVSHTVAEAIDTGLVPFTAEDAATLRRLLAAHGADVSAVDYGVREDPGAPPFTFAPTPPWGTGPADEMDPVVLAAVPGAGATALWRAWRYPPHGLEPPRRVFLAEAAVDADLPGVTSVLQDALSRAGEISPQVETYATGTRLPDYQRAAQEMAERLWPRPYAG